MDKLLNEFTVHRPIAETWNVLTDVERIAPCMPGAALEEIEGDIFRGVVKVKLGAISTAFKGQANFVERDDTAHRAVLKAEGRDTTGKGNASALITAQLESIDAGTTKCVVETDLHVTGKVAQFGRGIMGDVSKKLMNQFATNLNTMLDQQPGSETPAEAPAEAPATPPAAAAAAAPSAAANGATAGRRSRLFARSTARPQRRSSCPTWPVRRSSSAFCRWSAVSCCSGSLCDASAVASNVGDDVAAVRELIGRSPAARSRSSCAMPMVSRSCFATLRCSTMASRCRPATGWSARHEVLAVSRLEATGGACAEPRPSSIRHWSPTPTGATPPSATRPVPADHTGPRPHGGVGGTRVGVKCLHAHYAWFLAGGDDPVGAWVARQLAGRRPGSDASRAVEREHGDGSTRRRCDRRRPRRPAPCHTARRRVTDHQRVRLRSAAAGGTDQCDRCRGRSPRRHVARPARRHRGR